MLDSRSFDLLAQGGQASVFICVKDQDLFYVKVPRRDVVDRECLVSNSRAEVAPWCKTVAMILRQVDDVPNHPGKSTGRYGSIAIDGNIENLNSLVIEFSRKRDAALLGCALEWRSHGLPLDLLGLPPTNLTVRRRLTKPWRSGWRTMRSRSRTRSVHKSNAGRSLSSMKPFRAANGIKNVSARSV